MKCYTSKGTICIPGDFNLIYAVCDLTYELYEDDTFRYTFEPRYSTIDLLSSKYFQGIPGLNLDLSRDKYIRENILPTFISERVPSEKREDYQKLLQEAGLDYMDPILYLINTELQYFGDPLFMMKEQVKETVCLDDDNSHENNIALIKKFLTNLCIGNDIKFNNQIITDENRKIFHDIFLGIYSRSYEAKKNAQAIGIKNAKAMKKYKGRKPTPIDTIKFLDLESDVKKGKLTVKQASEQLGISIDRYYRFRKKLGE